MVVMVMAAGCGDVAVVVDLLVVVEEKRGAMPNPGWFLTGAAAGAGADCVVAAAAAGRMTGNGTDFRLSSCRGGQNWRRQHQPESR